VITRVNAKTPLANPALDWLKQIVLIPSTLLSESFEHEFAPLTRAMGEINPGYEVALNVVPVTPDHAVNESVIACSISVSWAFVCEAATVTIVGGANGNDVLHCRLSGAASDKFHRSGCGHPPAVGTVVSNT
jgi:hypothetical protein